MSSVATVAQPERQPRPWDVKEEGVLRLVEHIARTARPLRITAFGSRARGTHRPDSDLDLAVMIPVGGDAEAVYRARSGVDAPFPVDVLVFDEARHEWMKESIISVHYDIAREGAVLYDGTTGSVDHRAIAEITR